ncbi:hypothetical protein MAR_030627 [Mya arenaria]|uniref:Uncharacterized protein n=1 Tax=Mya arenaria TaxID=6604 RepID=A0ABY7F1H5_MYAAR|nr:hypothetical protein MAR_030627 [Mya arenaria]
MQDAVITYTRSSVETCKKCVADDCAYCTINPPRIPEELFKELYFVPDSTVNANGYTPFDELYGTETDDSGRPSLTLKPQSTGETRSFVNFSLGQRKLPVQQQHQTQQKKHHKYPHAKKGPSQEPCAGSDENRLDEEDNSTSDANVADKNGLTELTSELKKTRSAVPKDLSLRVDSGQNKKKKLSLSLRKKKLRKTFSQFNDTSTNIDTETLGESSGQTLNGFVDSLNKQQL